MTNEEKIIKKQLNEIIDLRINFSRAMGMIDFLDSCDLGSITRNGTIEELRSQLELIKDQVNNLLNKKNCK